METPARVQRPEPPSTAAPLRVSLGVPVLQPIPSSQTQRWAQHLPGPPRGSGSGSALPRALLLKAPALKSGSRWTINRTNLLAIPHLGDPSLPGHREGKIYNVPCHAMSFACSLTHKGHLHPSKRKEPGLTHEPRAMSKDYNKAEPAGYLLWASATGISSLYHISLESLKILKNWHQSFRFPDASENCSALILRITCGAKDRVQRDGW